MTERVKMERTITFGLVATLLIQTAGGLIWVGAAEARLAELEAEMDTRWVIGDRLARLEGQTTVMRQSLRRIEEALHDDK